MADDEIDYAKLPLDERSIHKSWKARLGAYEELIKLFRTIDDEKSPEWSKHVSNLRKFPADAHAAAQEKGLEAVLLFLENSSQGPKIVSEIMSGVIGKCLTSSRARTKELANEVTMMCVEIEKFEAVQEELMKGMDAKNPKVVAGSIGLTTQALREFGPKVLNLKTLIKKFLPLFEDRDKGVRDETKKLTIELYRWIGAGFKGQLSSLKPVMLTELEAEFEKLGNQKPQPTRYLKSQQAKKEQQNNVESAETGEAECVEEEAGPEIDPYDLIEPEDILSKLPKDFYEKSEAKKWQERKEALEAVEALTNKYQKLEPGDYGDLIRVLKRVIAKDSNVVVVALAGKCITGLANGLKKKFSPYASSCISTILEKFKEKKPAVLAAMKEASDACFTATNLEQIQEDAVASLQSKNPATKAETALFLSRSFSKTPNKTLSDKKFMKPYLTALFANLNESDPVVRDSATEALGVVFKSVGEKALIAYTSDLDSNKMTKLKEAADKAVVLVQKVSAASKLAAAPKPSATKAAAAPKPAAAAKPVATPSSTNVVKKAPTAVRKPTGSGTLVKKPTKPKVMDDYSADSEQGPSSRFSPPPNQSEDGNARVDISGEANEILLEKLSDKNWKVREEALDKLTAIVVKAKNITPNLGELPAAICARLQDSNRNLAASAFLLCQNLAGALGPHCHKHIRNFLPSLLNGLADTKANVRSTAAACLNAWAENCGVDKFFQGEMMAEAIKGQSPVLRTELFNWLTVRLPEVSKVSKEDLAACLPALLSCVEDRNVEVRKSAQDAVLPFMIHLGYEAMNRACGRLKPASKMLVQPVLDKARASLPSKSQAALTNKPSTAGRASVGSAPAKNDKSFTKQDSPPGGRESGEFSSAGNKRGVRNGPTKLSDKDLMKSGLPRTMSANTGPSSATGLGSVGSGQHYSNEKPSPVSSLSSANSSPSGTGPPYRPNLNETIDLGPRPHSPLDEYMGGSDPEDENIDVLRIEPENFNHPRHWKCPAEYQVDFDAIDKRHGEQDLLPMPPLQLLDTNTEFLKQEAPIQLPRRRYVPGQKLSSTEARTKPSTAAASDSTLPIRASQSIDLLISQISGHELVQSQEAVVQLEGIISDPAVSTVMLTRVDHILVCSTMAMRKLQTYLKSEDVAVIEKADTLYRCITKLLQSIFASELLPKRGTKESLKDLVYHLLLFLVDPNINKLPGAIVLIKHVNVLVVRVIENSDPNAIMCAIMRLLNDAMQTPNNHKLMDLTMKCQWKVLKLFGQWKNNKSYEFDTDGFLNEFYFFMRSHPFSSFESHELTPLKTMKTIVHSVVMNLGPHNVQASLNELPEVRNSEAGYYLNKLVAREIAKGTHEQPTKLPAATASSSSSSSSTRALNSNNNLQQFFTGLPEPTNTGTADERVALYMERLNAIQKRGGIGPNFNNN